MKKVRYGSKLKKLRQKTVKPKTEYITALIKKADEPYEIKRIDASFNSFCRICDVETLNLYNLEFRDCIIYFGDRTTFRPINKFFNEIPLYGTIIICGMTADGVPTDITDEDVRRLTV